MRNDIEQAAENSQLYCGRLNICNLTIWGCGSSFKMLISRMAVLGTPSSCHQTLKHFRSWKTICFGYNPPPKLPYSRGKRGKSQPFWFFRDLVNIVLTTCLKSLTGKHGWQCYLKHLEQVFRTDILLTGEHASPHLLRTRFLKKSDFANKFQVFVETLLTTFIFCQALWCWLQIHVRNLFWWFTFKKIPPKQNGIQLANKWGIHSNKMK